MTFVILCIWKILRVIYIRNLPQLNEPVLTEDACWTLVSLRLGGYGFESLLLCITL